MTPSSSARLLADVLAQAEEHLIDAGVLGEYAMVGRQRGPDAANELYPRLAAHLRPGCEGCQHDLEALEALARRAGSAVGNAPASAASGGPAQVGAASDTPLSDTAEETAASDAL